jgi:drug/metabolite transporter (DMT)-like permease
LKKGYLEFLCGLLFFGSSGVAAAHVPLPSYQVVFGRNVIGFLFLLLVFLLMRQKTTFCRHPKDAAFIAVSGLAMGVGSLFLYEAYDQIGMGLATLSYYCGPVIVMALSPLIFKEKFTVAKTAGFLLVLVGMLLVNGKISAAGGNTWGIFCGVMSALFFSLLIIFNKKATGIRGMENSLLQLFFCSLAVTVFNIFKGGFAVELTAGEWLWFLVLGLFNMGVGSCLYFSGMKKLPVQSVAICGYLEPLVAVVLGVLLLGEVMLPLQVLGGALIIGGAVLGEARFRKRPVSGVENGIEKR